MVCQRPNRLKECQGPAEAAGLRSRRVANVELATGFGKEGSGTPRVFSRSLRGASRYHVRAGMEGVGCHSRFPYTLWRGNLRCGGSSF